MTLRAPSLINGNNLLRRAGASFRRPSPVPPPLQGGPFEQIETEVGPLWLQTSDEVMRPYLLRRKSWDEPTAAVLHKLLRPGARFLDVGASIGYFTIWANRLALDLEIDAVEPHPELFGLLEANVWANEARARLHRVALGDTRLLLPMSSPPMNPAAATLGTMTPDGRYNVVVPVVRADELFPRQSFDVVKVNAEGFEPEIVLGMERLIRESPSIVLVVRFRPSGLEQRALDPSEVLERYRRLGFRLVVNDDGGTGTCTAAEVLQHCRSAGPDGQVNLIMTRDA